MTLRALKWHIEDLSRAMDNAISQCANNRFLRRNGSIIKFNGFWRDGDKQNVCAWLDKATWHDAKTGDGGGCKEFAETAFNMTLAEFMERYGHAEVLLPKVKPLCQSNRFLENYVEQIWQEITLRDQKRVDHAEHWLTAERGIINPRSCIGSGFANLFPEYLGLFAKTHHTLIKNRLELGPHLIAPIRSVCSPKVKNLFFRAMHKVEKDQKSRLLTGMGGFGSSDNELRAFGFPHLIHDFSNVILCEGMADYFAAEFLLDDNKEYLPIGAAHAGALVTWAQWLVNTNYKGNINIIFHIDTDHDDNISIKEVGPAKAVQAARILHEYKIRVQIFPWHFYLQHITNNPRNVRDLADSLQGLLRRECDVEHLRHIFCQALKIKGDR